MTAVRYEAADSRATETRRLALRRELQALIRSWNPAVSSDLDDHCSLIASGVIDSLSLFNLILWIEAKSGRTIDPAAVDVTRDWDTIAAILQYLDPSPENVRGGGAEPVKTTRRQSRYRIVGYRPEFKGAVARFQTGLWSPDPDKNLRYLEWKYEDNPYSDPGRIYLAFDDAELVGMRGFYPSCWQIGQPPRCVRLLVADDLLVSEQHRNQGLVGEIMSAARDDLRRLGERYVINLSGGTLTVLESLAMGWRATGMLGPMSRQSSSGSFYRKLGRLFTRVTHAAHVDNSHDNAGSFSRLDGARNPHRTDVGLEVEIDSRPRIPEMVDLIERVGYDGRLRHVRDRDYLDWRYRNPFREYRFLYSADDALNGFLVLRRAIDRVPPRRQVSIVDLEAINDRVACALLETAVHAGSFEELQTWAATMRAPAIAQLRRLGFRPANSQLTASGTPYLLVWSLGSSEGDDQWHLEGVNLLDFASWDVRTIYSMFG